jgi:DNA-binding NtrC family response regulator
MSFLHTAPENIRPDLLRLATYPIERESARCEVMGIDPLRAGNDSEREERGVMSDTTLTVGDPLSQQVVKGPKRLWAICRNAERTEIARALVENGHNRTHAAHALGISRRTLLNKIKQYGLTRAICRQLAGDVLPQPLVAAQN